MEFIPQAEGEEAGLLVTQNERFSLLLVKERKSRVDSVTCYQILNGERIRLASEPTDAKRVYLFVEGTAGAYRFYWGTQEREHRPLGPEIDGTCLSTLVADGYVGVMMGPYAACARDNAGPANHADFDWFRYEPIEG